MASKLPGKWRTVLALLASVTLIGAGGPARAITAGLNPAQVVALAERFLAEGRIDDAATLVDGLAARGDGGSQRLFLQGLIALERKQYALAERLFRQILRDEPGTARVRLELARTLFLAEKWSASDYQFRLADATPLPAATRRIIRQFREQIRDRRTWTATVELGLAPDTNINQGSESDVAVIYGRPFELSADAQRRSGVGITLAASGEARLLRGPNSALVVSGFANIIEYDGGAFDDYLVGGAIGRQQRAGRGRVTVAATGFRRWYGNRPYATGYGLRAQYDSPVAAWQRTLQLGVQRIVYDRSVPQTGVAATASLGIGRALSTSSYGAVQLSLTRQGARDPGYAFVDAGLGLNYYRDLPWGVSGGLDFALDRTIYDAAIPAYGAEPRRQWRGRAGFSIAKRDWLFAGFAPAIRVSQTILRSNIPLFDFDRRRIELTVVRPL